MENKKYDSLIDSLKRLAAMYVTNFKLTSTEKISLMLSGMALFSIALILGLMALVFIFIGLAALLDSVLPPFCSYMIIGGLCLIALVLLIVFKKQLIVNPVAKYVSRLILEHPDSSDNKSLSHNKC